MNYKYSLIPFVFFGMFGCKSIPEKGGKEQQSKLDTIKVLDPKKNPLEKYVLVKQGIKEAIELGLYYKMILLGRSGLKDDESLDAKSDFTGNCSNLMAEAMNGAMKPGQSHKSFNETYQSWRSNSSHPCISLGNTLWKEFGLEPNPVSVDWFNQNGCTSEWSQYLDNRALTGVSAGSNRKSRLITRQICGNGSQTSPTTGLRAEIISEENCLARTKSVAHRLAVSSTPDEARLYPQDICCIQKLGIETTTATLRQELLNAEGSNSTQSSGIALKDINFNSYTENRVNKIVTGISQTVNKVHNQCQNGNAYDFFVTLGGFVNSNFVTMASEDSNFLSNTLGTIFSKNKEFHKAWTKDHAKAEFACGIACAGSGGESFQDIFDLYKVEWLSPMLNYKIEGTNVTYQPIVLNEYSLGDKVFATSTEGVGRYMAWITTVISPLPSYKKKFVDKKVEEYRKLIADVAATSEGTPEKLRDMRLYYFSEDGQTPTDTVTNDALMDYLASGEPVKLSIRFFRFEWKDRNKELDPFSLDNIKSPIRLNSFTGSFMFLDNAPVVEFSYDPRKSGEDALTPLQVGTETVIAQPKAGMVSTLTWLPNE